MGRMSRLNSTPSPPNAALLLSAPVCAWTQPTSNHVASVRSPFFMVAFFAKVFQRHPRDCRPFGATASMAKRYCSGSRRATRTLQGLYGVILLTATIEHLCDHPHRFSLFVQALNPAQRFCSGGGPGRRGGRSGGGRWRSAAGRARRRPKRRQRRIGRNGAARGDGSSVAAGIEATPMPTDDVVARHPHYGTSFAPFSSSKRHRGNVKRDNSGRTATVEYDSNRVA